MNYQIYRSIYNTILLMVLSCCALTTNAIDRNHHGVPLQGSQITVGAKIPLIISASSSGTGGQDYVTNYTAVAQLSYDRVGRSDVAGQNWSYEISYQLTDRTNSGNVVTYTESLIISNNNSEGTVEIIGAHPLLQTQNSNSVNVELEITGITCLNGNGSIGCNAANNGIPNDDIEVRLFVKEERYNFLSVNTNIHSTTSVTSFLGNNGNLLIAWSPKDGAESYELEWVYWDATNVGQPDDRYSLEQFFAKATRVEVTNNIYAFDAIYPDGDLYVRVRPIGRYIRGVNNGNYTKIKFGSWFEDNGNNPTIVGSSHKVTLANAFEKEHNWQFQRSYAEGEKHKQVIQYFDDGLKGRQTLTDLSSDDLTIIAENVYDVEGRPSLSILPVPVKSAASGSALIYGGGLSSGLINITGPTAVDYGREKFDKLTVLNQANAAPLTGHISNDYYSSSNPFQTGADARIHAEYIDDAKGYPLTQTKYLRDATGRPSSQSGVGDFYQIGKGKETKYYYSNPTSTELHRLFGSNVGDAKHYRKNYVVDANGQISVSYIDQAGQTIATALAGVSPDNVDKLDSQDGGSKTIHASLMGNNKISDVGEVSTLTHQIFCDEAPRTDHFTYEFEGGILSSTNPTLCMGCSYELSISIENESGSKVPLNITQLPVPVSVNFNTNPQELILNFGHGNPDCTNPTYPLGSTLEFNATLPYVGTYTLRKVLRVTGPNIDEIIEEIDANISTSNPTFKDNFIDQYIVANWTDECEDCSEELRRNIAEELVRTEQPNLETDFPTLFETTVMNYFNSAASCDELEEKFVVDASLRSECDGLLELMKQQLSPGGCLYTSNFYQTLYENGHLVDLDLYSNGILEEDVTDTGDGTNLSSSNYNDYLTKPADWQHQLLEELLPLHPEYCRYQECNSDLMRDSRKFDFDLAKYTTWAEVGVALNFPIGGTSADWMELINHDPYMASINPLGAQAKIDLQNILSNYCTTAASQNPGVSCGASCLDIFCFIDNYANNPSHIGTLTPEMTWTIFRGIYTTQKNIVIKNHKCTPNTYGMSPYPCDPVDNDDASTEVGGQDVSANNLDDKTSLQNAVNLGLAENEALICEGHASAWMEHLCPECIVQPGIALSTFCTSLKAELKAYCEETCGDHLSTNPMGYLLVEDLTTNTHLIAAQNLLNSAAGNNCTANLSDIAVNRLDVYEQISSTNYPGYSRFDVQRCSVLTDAFQVLNSTIFPTPATGGTVLCPDVILDAYNITPPNSWTASLVNVPGLYKYTTSLGSSAASGWTTFGNTHGIIVDEIRLYNDHQFGGSSYYPNYAPLNRQHRAIMIGSGTTPGSACKGFSFELIETSTGQALNPIEIISIGAFDCKTNTVMVTVKENCSFTTFPPASNCTQANCGAQRTVAAYVSLQLEPCTPTWEETNVWIPKEDKQTIDLQLVQVQCSTQLAAKLKLQAEEAYDAYLRGLAEDVISEQNCLEAAVENFKTTYTTTEHHYTLYYYDEAGSLIQTLPPVAVKPLNSEDATKFNLTTGKWITNVEPPHIFEMATTYQYNTLGQVHTQQSPDGGVTKFWYDYAQRLRLSQNANQVYNAVNNADVDFAYTKFDEQGRTVEVGKLELSGNHTLTKEEINNPNFPITGRSERILTEYDKASFSPIAQDNLRGRVARTYNDHIATYYNYDIHGNVKTLHHQIGKFGASQIDYEYDLITGNVNQVSFQKGTKDQFFHRYQYDADNRLTRVKTSNNQYTWDQDARYFYYAHGPLARVELGADQVQGLDYFYNLQGWIKGVNNTTPNTDMGKDGLTGTVNGWFGTDVAAYYLGYHRADYTPIGGGINMGAFAHGNTTNFDADILGTGGTKGLYNGNISFMVSHIPSLGNALINSDATQAMVYQYDALHRIKQAKSFSYNGIWNNDYKYQSNYSYDGNGNIQTLNRHAYKAVDNYSYHIDNLTYNYDLANKRLNRLKGIADIGAVVSKMGDVQSINNFEYDEIGNLINDGSNSITWNLQNKVATVDNTTYHIEYAYDVSGNRLSKALTQKPLAGAPPSPTTTTFYIRDASGNIMGTYDVVEDGTPTKDIKENSIYGSARLGIHNYDVPLTGTSFVPITTLPKLMDEVLTLSNTVVWEKTRGKKVFEISNHLGNVLATVSDKKLGIDNGSDGIADSYIAQVKSAQDYFPFGWEMPGRKFNTGNYKYGFNGKENDRHWGDQLIQDYGFRLYNPAIAKFLSVDPLSPDYPELTPYQFSHNRPIDFIDIDGLEGITGITSPSVPGTDFSPAIDNINSNVVVRDYLNPHRATSSVSVDRSGENMQMVAELAMGVTPAGVLIDVKDLGGALHEGNGWGIAFGIAGFLPGGDLVKNLYKRGGKYVDEVVDNTPRFYGTGPHDMVDAHNMTKGEISNGTFTVKNTGTGDPYKVDLSTDNVIITPSQTRNPGTPNIMEGTGNVIIQGAGRNVANVAGNNNIIIQGTNIRGYNELHLKGDNNVTIQGPRIRPNTLDIDTQNGIIIFGNNSNSGHIKLYTPPSVDK